MWNRALVWLAVVAIVALPAAALAQDEPPASPAASPTAVSDGSRVLDATSAAYLAAPLGAGLVIIGGALGIGRIGGSAVEALARQPEAAGPISTAMIITAAMIEGAALFGVVVCLLAVLK